MTKLERILYILKLAENVVLSQPAWVKEVEDRACKERLSEKL